MEVSVIPVEFWIWFCFRRRLAAAESFPKRSSPGWEKSFWNNDIVTYGSVWEVLCLSVSITSPLMFWCAFWVVYLGPWFCLLSKSPQWVESDSCFSFLLFVCIVVDSLFSGFNYLAQRLLFFFLISFCNVDGSSGSDRNNSEPERKPKPVPRREAPPKPSTPSVSRPVSKSAPQSVNVWIELEPITRFRCSKLGRKKNIINFSFFETLDLLKTLAW